MIELDKSKPISSDEVVKAFENLIEAVVNKHSPVDGNTNLQKARFALKDALVMYVAF
jgi:hypothetical protein